MTTVQYYRPKGAEKYKNEYIIFFDDQKDPEVLFHTLMPEEAYKKAKEISLQQKKTPIVERVVEKDYCFY